MEYRRVTAAGEFDHDAEIYMGPKYLGDSRLISMLKEYFFRSFISPDGDSGGIISSGDKVGWLVVTPFVLADSGSLESRRNVMTLGLG